jgi:hypothetical protein
VCGRVAFGSPQAKRFIWLTTEDALMDTGLLGRQWVSLDQADNRSYVIVGSTQQVADVA